MRFACVHAEKATHAVRCLCRVLHGTPSGYYAWATRPPSRRQREDVQLRARIRAIHTASRGTYGSPRIYEQLRQDGVTAGRERVARLLRDMGLIGLPVKRFRRTTDSAHQHPVAANVLARDFDAAQPNERWSTDITCLWTGEGWLYLAVVLDLFARRVVGWAIQPHLRTELALEALHMALGRRVPEAGLVHHSDRGCQYAADAYQRVLRDHAIVCSMSRKGDCWDNAVTESFFATLKTKLIHRQPWPTRRGAKDAVAEYIEGSTIRTDSTRRAGTSVPMTVNGGMPDRLSVQLNQPVHFSRARSRLWSERQLLPRITRSLWAISAGFSGWPGARRKLAASTAR